MKLAKGIGLAAVATHDQASARMDRRFAWTTGISWRAGSWENSLGRDQFQVNGRPVSSVVGAFKSPLSETWGELRMVGAQCDNRPHRASRPVARAVMTILKNCPRGQAKGETSTHASRRFRSSSGPFRL